MTKAFKPIVLDFAGYAYYWVPEGSVLLPKTQPLSPDYQLLQTDYVYLRIDSSDMEPTIRHDSYVRGQIVEPGQITSLTQGVYAAALHGQDEGRVTQLIVGRLKQKPTRQLTLWGDGAAHRAKKVVLVENVAFLFQVIWTWPRESYLILPR